MSITIGPFEFFPDPFSSGSPSPSPSRDIVEELLEEYEELEDEEKEDFLRKIKESDKY